MLETSKALSTNNLWMVKILMDVTMNNQQETKIASFVMSRILRDYA